MIPLGLTASQQRAFHEALTRDHDLDIRVELMDMEENVTGDLSDWLEGGQVVVDNSADAGVSRSCQLTIIDPEHRAGIDPRRPGPTTHLDNMISVHYGVLGEGMDDWVYVPVFRGPLAKATRDGDMLELEALGKESLLQHDAGWSHQYPQGVRRAWVIEDIARRCGERNLAIPTWWAPRTSRTGTMIKLGPPNGSGSDWSQSHPWVWMRHAARSMRAQLWYDGAGTLRMRLEPVRTSWWFYDHHLMSEPKTTVDSEDIFNTVWVKGSPPEGKSWTIEAVGSIIASHPNSVQSLARRGWYRYLVDTIEDDDIRTVHDARVARDRRLKELASTDFSVEFDCFPIPHLDPDDIAWLGWDGMSGNFRVRKFTLPLAPGESMSMGYVKETRRTPHMRKAQAMRARNRRREVWR